jgi:hypothetical protein
MKRHMTTNRMPGLEQTLQQLFILLTATDMHDRWARRTVSGTVEKPVDQSELPNLGYR